MTIIEKILLELCAKDVVEDGMPDFTNEKHLLALNEVLVELNWPMDARGELLYTLMEVEKTSFVGITKDKKRRYFKDKEALDKAVDAGSVTLPDDKEKEKDDDGKQSSDTKVTDFERPGSKKQKGGRTRNNIVTLKLIILLAQIELCTLEMHFLVFGGQVIYVALKKLLIQ